jgi:hypothetical protein
MEKFWNKVEMIPFHDCWEWTSKSKDLYGRIIINKKPIRAHRMSWQLHYGPIPKGLFVCHKCDNPGCVRPDHLFLGTNKDNSNDRDAKGRTAKGTQLPKCKLQESDVIEIRDLYNNTNITMIELTFLYPICRTNIHIIVHRKAWKHI